jgi:hypothetical protein
MAGRRYTKSDLHQAINRCQTSGSYSLSVDPGLQSQPPVTTTYYHLIEHDEVAMAMTSLPTLLVGQYGTAS